MKKQQFKYDHRNNAGLHCLYIKFAISGILAIDVAIKRISDEAKTSHCEILLAMFNTRKKLIKEDAAYNEANELLEDLAKRGLLSRCGEIFIANSWTDQ